MTGRASGEPGDGREPSGAAAARPGFAHASEAEFARILDFYQVEWRYEPHVFPILWSLDGDVLESFAPDFYLPELDLYVEMTTLRQKLVRKKNRKLRRLRELYPDVRIKLFYARDFRALMLKYGRVALADALSGSEGQFTPANPGPSAEPHPATVGPRPASPVPSPTPKPSMRPPLAPRPAGARKTVPGAAAPALAAAVPTAASPAGVPSTLVRRPSASGLPGPSRRRARPPAARIARSSGGAGRIGGDTPAGPAVSATDEEAGR